MRVLSFTRNENYLVPGHPLFYMQYHAASHLFLLATARETDACKYTFSRQVLLYRGFVQERPNDSRIRGLHLRDGYKADYLLTCWWVAKIIG